MSMHSPKVILLLFLFFLPLLWSEDGHAAKKRTINNVKREQQAAQKSIKETSRKLNVTRQQAAQNKEKLGQLEGQLRDKGAEINSIKSSIAQIDDSMRLASATMTELESQLAVLKEEYARSLRKMQGSVKATGIISFIFTPELYHDVNARYRYSGEFAKWRKRKVREIKLAASKVESQRRLLASLRGERNKSLSDLSSAEIKLRELRDETDRTVSKLEKESTRLKADIAKSQKRLKNLDSELDRMIIAQQRQKEEQQRKSKQSKSQKSKSADKKRTSPARKETPKTSQNLATTKKNATPEERAVNSRFENNKGNLLFPVTGSYKIERRFGRQSHPEMDNVVIDSPGIDISTPAGAQARCIFDGVVSGVFSHDGFNKVVMVRHGQYITIYANLSKINVKTGDRVRRSQILGTVGPDPQYSNRPVMHFEIRLERTKLNPLSWVR